MMAKRYLHKSRGQSTVEYAVLLAIVASALIAMQVYVKRGVQGRIRDLADQINPGHYEPGRTESVYSTTQSGKMRQQYDSGVARIYQDNIIDLNGDGNADCPECVPENITRSGYEVVYPEVE